MGYILSKMNMLILVTAIFGIVAFFLFSRCDESCATQGRITLDALTQLTDQVTNSTAFCAENRLSIPTQLNCQCSANNRVFYRLVISKLAPDVSSGQSVSTLVFTVQNRSTNQVLASRSIPTTAEILLYYWPRPADPSGSVPSTSMPPVIENLFKNGFVAENNALTKIVLDPQATPDRILDQVVLIKETRAENNELRDFIHVIPCALNSADSCIKNKVAVNDWLKNNAIGNRSSGASRCLE